MVNYDDTRLELQGLNQELVALETEFHRNMQNHSAFIVPASALQHVPASLWQHIRQVRKMRTTES